MSWLSRELACQSYFLFFFFWTHHFHSYSRNASLEKKKKKKKTVNKHSLQTVRIKFTFSWPSTDCHNLFQNGQCQFLSDIFLPARKKGERKPARAFFRRNCRYKFIRRFNWITTTYESLINFIITAVTFSQTSNRLGLIYSRHLRGIIALADRCASDASRSAIA